MLRFARDRAPEETGNLKNSGEMVPLDSGAYPLRFAVEFPLEYAKYQDEGTGVYAGRDRIRPVRANALVFHWKKAGGVVAFASVKGTPPTYFFTNTITELAWAGRLQLHLGK